ncbi:hypothetical protein FA15DRAFT_101951 [Coprinopsis marcescibilis]|uniref:Transmembrane protein n=1 Tax=Coprinopsis marcescibilis TaxID=230819 RepID=A0A5C3KKR8_COPMA|nr:hypothetical protein FA15DRAFT_101951 [Coprinopsis marcescibilis]
MPNVTLSIEDSSPLISYSPEWVPGSEDDPLIDEYSGGNYMVTNSSGAAAFFVFRGFDVQIFGARRPNYGSYQTTMNTEVYSVRQANSDPPQFRSNLWDLSWPRSIPRTVKIESQTNGRPIDLDFITWVFPVGRDDEDLIVKTVQDSDASFKYSPTVDWHTDPYEAASFLGGSGHAAYVAGSTFEFTFEGDAVSLFGPVGPQGVPYYAFTDTDGLPEDFTTRKPSYRPNTMLYHRANLGPGRHTVKLTVSPFNLSTGQESYFAIDYAEVYTAPSLVGSNAGAGQLSTGAVIGITVAVFIAVLLVLLIIGWMVLRRFASRKGRTFYVGFLSRDLDVDPFRYNTISPQEVSPPVSAAQANRLNNHASFNSLTTPSSSQWPQSAGLSYASQAVNPNDSSAPQLSSRASFPGQEVVVPPRGIMEKSRAPVTLQPPPTGAARPRNGMAPAAHGAAQLSVSPVAEEGTMLSLGSAYSTDSQTRTAVPPPKYTLNPSPNEASSTYTRG